MTDRLRVHVDGQCLQTVSRVRGIGRYVSQLLFALAERDDVEVLLALNAAFPDELVEVRDDLARRAPAIRCTQWESARCAPENATGHEERREASELALVHHINHHGADIAVSAAPFEGLLDHSVPLLPSSALAVPAVALWYDAIPYRFADDYLPNEPLRRAYLRRLERTRDFDHLWCISAFAEREAADLLAAQGRTTNIDGAAAELFRSHLGDVDRRGGDDTLLYVGGFDARKNVGLIADAMAILERRIGRSTTLTVVGPSDGPQLEEFLAAWRGAGLSPDHLDVCGTVSDDELLRRYRQAAVLIQPSLMEGFGLTALEAMSIGTPVVAARAGALPDVVGDDDLLFDPRSPDELADRLERVLTDHAFRDAQVARGRTHAADYSWTAVADRAAASLRTLEPATAAREPDTVAAIAARRLLPVEMVAQTLARAEPIAQQPPRLFVDVSSTVTSDRHTGIQRVVRRTCDALTDDREISDRVHIIGCADESGWFDLDGLGNGVPEQGDRPDPRPGDIVLMLDSSWEFYDLHRPFLMAARAQGCQVISCLYDIVPLSMPAFCADGMPDMFRRWFVHALEVSTGFVCISQAVADDLLALLDAVDHPRPVEVGHWQLGCDFLAAPPDAAASATEHAAPVVLMVGTVEPRKGHVVALDAIERLWASGVEIELVIAGGEGWAVDDLVARLRTHPEFGRRLRWYEKVDDARLASLYRSSDILLAASWGEGFGLPIVEAARDGVRLVASDIPVFREVGRATADPVFFETGDAGSLEAALRTVLDTAAATGAVGEAWPDWHDGTRQLSQMLLEGNWYRTYEPASSATPDTAGAHRHGALRLIDAPHRRPDRGGLHLKVAATNTSETAWLGELHADAQRSVRLVIGLPTDGAVRDGRMVDTPMPYAVPAGATVYLELVVPDSWIDRDDVTLAVALADTRRPFGSPLMVEVTADGCG